MVLRNTMRESGLETHIKCESERGSDGWLKPDQTGTSKKVRIGMYHFPDRGGNTSRDRV